MDPLQMLSSPVISQADLFALREDMLRVGYDFVRTYPKRP